MEKNVLTIGIRPTCNLNAFNSFSDTIANAMLVCTTITSYKNLSHRQYLPKSYRTYSKSFVGVRLAYITTRNTMESKPTYETNNWYDVASHKNTVLLLLRSTCCIAHTSDNVFKFKYITREQHRDGSGTYIGTYI